MSKNVIYVVHVLVKRNQKIEKIVFLYSMLCEYNSNIIDVGWLVSNQGTSAPYLSFFLGFWRPDQSLD